MRFAIALALFAATVARAAEVVSPVIPQGLGVNIHFTDEKPGELKMLADAGFKIVRMDFDWARIETERGKYDFSAYDRLVKSLDEHGLRALFILDYANPLYDDNRSPDTDEGRQAFARWAAAAVEHFKGKRILWEMYNEPNIAPFWRPRPDTDNYIKLAREVGRAIKRAAPGEIYIGPACSGVDLPFLEACFKADLLEYWDAVSVHPYRQSSPETAADDYRALRRLIARYSPGRKTPPILSGEWGYSSAWSGVDEDRQAKMLARQWLVNLSNDVPVSIWYDWRDDGPDEKEPEHHFGTATLDGKPKPAYRAAAALTGALGGFSFNKRLALGGSDQYMLLFSRGDEVRVVAWTTSPQPQHAVLPASAGTFQVRSHLNEPLDPVTADEDGIAVILTDAPLYFIPEKPNELLQLAAAWARQPAEMELIRPPPLPAALEIPQQLANPLTREVCAAFGQREYTLAAGETVEATAVVPLPAELGSEYASRIECEFVGVGKVAQPLHVAVQDAMKVTVLPRIGKVIPVRVDNIRGDPFEGNLAVVCPPHPAGNVTPLKLDAGNPTQTTINAAPPNWRPDYQVATMILRADGSELLACPTRHYRAIPLEAAAMEIRAEGDQKVASMQLFEIVPAPAGLPAPGALAPKIEYSFEPGWKYVCLSAKPQPIAIDGKPAVLGMWLHGDGSGNFARIRFVDSTGQTFQPDGIKLDFAGWKYVEFPLDGRRSGFWGGAKDGVIHYPIGLETLLLIDSAARQKTAGTVHLSSPTLVYDP